MFLDESGDHNLEKIDQTYPMFVLSGCIFDLDYYRSFVEPEARRLKIKHFGNDDVILRSYDIRKQKRGFASLVDKKKREDFYGDLNSFISNLDFKIISAAINKTKLKSQYVKPDNPYEICLQFILERSVMYLGRTIDPLMFRIESRQTHNDEKLAKVYEDFRNRDHQLFKKDEIQRKLLDLSFNQKTQNVIGMQISDLVAYPIGRWVLDKNKENKPFEIIERKFHNNPKTRMYLNYGLKIFP
jgi:hypothetical protein